MTRVKIILSTIFAAITSVFGSLFIPCILLALANMLDYISGCGKAYVIGEKILPHKGFSGIVKKVCMWFLVAVGMMLDIIIRYSADVASIHVHITFLISGFVAVWLILNEMLSILRNIAVIGVKYPAFLEPLVENLIQEINIENGMDSSRDSNGK